MAVTVTPGPTHGKDAEFKADDSGGTLRDISPYVRSVTWSANGQVIDITGFKATSDFRSFLAGLKGATCSIDGVLNDTATTGSSVVLLGGEGSTRSIQYGPLGSTSGEPRLTAEAILESIDIAAGVEAESTFSASFTVTGAVTLATY
jgi:predicted secreted protein